MITDCRQAHDHQIPCLYLITTRPRLSRTPYCRALLIRGAYFGIRTGNKLTHSGATTPGRHHARRGAGHV